MTRVDQLPFLGCTGPFGFDEDPMAVLDAFAQIGCTSCQFYRRVSDPLDARFRTTSVDVPRASGIALAAGMRFDSIHGVFSEHIDPSAPDAAHRTLCLQIYEHEARLAQSLGGSMIVVHPGAINPGKRWRDAHELAPAAHAALNPLEDFLRRLADSAERVGATFLIENLPPSCSSGFDPAALAAVIRRVNSGRVRMCFDTGHAHCTASVFGPVSAMIASCADVIAYVHVHDNRADADSHLVPGDGTIDWNAVSSALGATGATRALELFDPASRLRELSRTDFPARIRQWLGTAC
ncbi:MAG: sugar phosphate isomerase/epimerase family protein [Phycisphaerales bacterium]